MEILTKTELSLRYDEFLNKIKKGAVFIHPTDTIYGLGCNAHDEKAVNKIRKIKERSDSPFSIWVPSMEWIRMNCVITKEAEQWMKKLPGPYTLILKLKNKSAVAKSVNLEKELIGIRFPNHWFGQVIKTLNFPIVTTSANKAGKKFMTTLENLDQDIEPSVEFIIYEGEKESHPSKIIDLVKREVKER